MKYKFLAAASAAVLPMVTAMFFAGKTVKAEANSAPPYWEGTDASGAVLKGDNCPVVVEKETLNLNIKSLPREGKIALNEYAAEAVAEYSFYNPTDSDIDMTLLFPFGEFPSYVPEGANDEVSAVSVDGESTECRVRYSYAPYEFDIDRDMARVSEEKKSDPFYREDRSVREYRLSLKTVEITDSNAEEGDYTLKIQLGFDPKYTRVLFPSASCTRLSIWNGDMYAGTSFKKWKEASVVFYAVGDPLYYVGPKLYKENKELYAVSEVLTSDTNFSEFVKSNQSDGSKVGEVDWYNAFVDMLNDRSGIDGSVDCFSLDEKDLMRWFEYQMQVPAKGRAVNRVRAPLYPTVEGNRNPRYEYSYLLSPAAKWAGFEDIEITIDTPYYLSNGSLNFSKTEKEDGEGFLYRYTRNSLPRGELTFVLTEKETADSDFNVFGRNFLRPSLTWAFVTLTVLAVIAAVVTVIVVVSLKKKRK